MPMDDVFFAIRVINMCWAMSLFFLMAYIGTLDLLLTRKCLKRHVLPENQLWAAASWAALFAVVASLIEIFVTDAKGGWRVFAIWPFLFLATWALSYGAPRVLDHKRAVTAGNC